MADPFADNPFEWDDKNWTLFESTVAQLEEAWNRKTDTKLSRFLPPTGDPQREGMLARLIAYDQQHYWEAGQHKPLEDYLEEWPELRANPEILVKLLHAECWTRTYYHETPTPAEIQSRFPEVSRRIDLKEIEAEARQERLLRDFGETPVRRSLSETSAGTVSKDRPPLLPKGHRLGHYEIRGLLGQGGMGTVYLAEDTELQQPVAIKIPHREQFPSADEVDRFLEEARTAAKLKHSGIVPVYYFGRQDDGTCYIVMEYVEGSSLAELMDHGPMSHARAATLVFQVADALGYAHQQGFVHRDIKPANIILDADGKPRITDFGLAINQSANRLEGGDLAGTLLWMAPEQVRGETQQLDCRADVWALGVILYQMLTRQRLFDSVHFEELSDDILHRDPTPPRQLDDTTPRDLEQICLRCLAKQATDRYATAGELAEALRPHVEGLPGRSKSRSRGRWRIRCFLAATILLVFATVTIYLKTGEGTLFLEVNEADAEVTIDGKPIRVESSRQAVSVSLGRHVLQVRKPEFASHVQSLTIRWRGSTQEVKIVLEPEGHAIPIQRWIETDCRVDGVPLWGIHGICLSGDGSTLYAACGHGDSQAPIQVWDVPSGKQKKLIPFPSSLKYPHTHKEVVLSADERYLYTTNYFKRYISRIDLRNHDARTDLKIGGVPTAVWAAGMGITPDKRKLVVLLGQDGRVVDVSNDQVSIVDVADGRFSLAGQVVLDDEPAGGDVAFSDDSRFVYVVTRRRKSSDPTLYEISLTPPYQVARTLTFPESALRGVAVSSRLNRLFVSDPGHRKIWVVDLEEFKPVSSIELDGHAPGVLAISAEDNLLAALCPTTRTLFCLNADHGTIVGKATGLRQGAGDVEFSSDRKYLFVAHGRVPVGGIAVICVRHLLNSIVFASDRAGEGYQIYVMASDGRNVVRLTNNHATDVSPRWSPDGRRIAFVSDRRGLPKVCVLDCANNAVRVLEDTDPVMGSFVRGSSVDWSPDGRQIAYVGDRMRAIRIVNAQTGKVRKLIEGDVGRGRSCHHGLCWRKTDGAILFHSQTPESAYTADIFQVNPKTGRITQLTNSWEKLSHFVVPAASPDGKKIAVLRQPNEEAPPRDIMLMDPDGTGLTLLSHVKGKTYATPEWFPDGKKLVCSATTGLFCHIYTIDADSGKPTQLTAGDYHDITPDVCRGPFAIPPAGDGTR